MAAVLGQWHFLPRVVVVYSETCFRKVIQELLEIFLHVTLGSCPDLLVLQIRHVICADVPRL